MCANAKAHRRRPRGRTRRRSYRRERRGPHFSAPRGAGGVDGGVRRERVRQAMAAAAGAVVDAGAASRERTHTSNNTGGFTICNLPWLVASNKFLGWWVQVLVSQSIGDHARRIHTSRTNTARDEPSQTRTRKCLVWKPGHFIGFRRTKAHLAQAVLLTLFAEACHRTSPLPREQGAGAGDGDGADAGAGAAAAAGDARC